METMTYYVKDSPNGGDPVYHAVIGQLDDPLVKLELSDLPEFIQTIMSEFSTSL